MSGRKNYSYVLTAARRAAEQVARAQRATQRAEAHRKRQEQTEARRMEAKQKAAEAKQRLEVTRQRARAEEETARQQALAEKEALARQEAAKQQALAEKEAARQKKAEIEQRLSDAERKTQNQIDTVARERSLQLTRQQSAQQLKNADRLTSTRQNTRTSLEAENQDGGSNLAQNLLGQAIQIDESKTTNSDSFGDQLPTQPFEPTSGQQQLNDQFLDNIASLESWLATLSNSSEVVHFASDRLRHWQQTTAILLVEDHKSVDVKERLVVVQQAILEAEQIEAEAIEVSEKFEQRNSVLKDILESLQEVGFFVQDPEYVDPTRPDQAVIIRANRADQTMEAKVELDTSVESDWQGIHGEYCTDAFFEYVKQMNQRGVEITSDNPQLDPVLKQQNALNLPTANEHRSGNE